MHKSLLHLTVVISLVASLSACIPPADASEHVGPYVNDQVETISLLKSKGYTEIKVIGFDLFGAACGKHDTYIDKFEATASDGRHVQGFSCGITRPEIKKLRYL